MIAGPSKGPIAIERDGSGWSGSAAPTAKEAGVMGDLMVFIDL